MWKLENVLRSFKCIQKENKMKEWCSPWVSKHRSCESQRILKKKKDFWGQWERQKVYVTDVIPNDNSNIEHTEWYQKRKDCWSYFILFF